MLKEASCRQHGHAARFSGATFGNTAFGFVSLTVRKTHAYVAKLVRFLYL